MPKIAVLEKNEPVTVEQKWYLCPKCHGLGEVPSDKRQPAFNGVKTIKHIICPVCDGKRVIKSGTNKAPDGGSLKPIELCPTCKNWYAIGGGKPADEPCYQDHFTLRDSISHCHWHDLSMPHFVVEVMKAEST